LDQREKTIIFSLFDPTTLLHIAINAEDSISLSIALSLLFDFGEIKIVNKQQKKFAVRYTI